MSKIRVLVIDDEEDFLGIVKLNLEQAGRYEVTTMSSAKNFLTSLEEHLPDVLLVDMNMPDVNGIEVCNSIGSSQDERIKNIPIIMISAIGDVNEQLKAWQAGILTFISKPATTSQIEAKIDYVLKRKAEKLGRTQE